jgi:hypothetical protein
MAALHLPATVVFLFGNRQLQARVASLQVAIKRCMLGTGNAWMYTGWSSGYPKSSGLGYVLRRSTVPAPEAAYKAATGYDVIRSFISLPTYFTPSIIQDMLVHWRRSALYPVLCQQPPEVLDP